MRVKVSVSRVIGCSRVTGSVNKRGQGFRERVQFVGSAKERLAGSKGLCDKLPGVFQCENCLCVFGE